MGGLDEMLQGLQNKILPPTPRFTIIKNSKEEEVEVRVVELKAFQHVKPKQIACFSSKPIQGGFFEVKLDSPNISIIVLTKACSSA
jgi:hypothetical protein